MNNTVWERLLNPEVLVIFLAIICVVTGIIAVTTIGIVKMVHKHNERIAMIQHGIHPDYPPENDGINHTE